jgi:nicotinate phosphoribosyltransferase
MRIPSELYRPSLALLTDLYQLTMAYGFWKEGLGGREAVFHLTFRKHPFQGGFSIAAGLAPAMDYLAAFRFEASDLEYLADLPGNDGRPLFERAFLDHLGGLSLSVDVDAIPEGTVVFPHEPLLRVRGPILQAQILETALLNIINFQTLIATKAARVCLAAKGEQVLEFGLRRAQGIDGALGASRAAYLGGCHATSNVLAGKIFGIPVRGTHAHSWVMFHDDELDAFQRYAQTLPNNCIFLVDTYDTLAGVHAAVEVGKWLRTQGHDLLGIRLDSGDLAYLSIEARKILDQSGFARAKIVASNDLDETLIQSLKEQGAQINVWGVGTKLVTGDEQPALGGVYKLSAVRKPGQPWQYKVKLSEQAIKVSTPGILQVRRFYDDQGAMEDMIFDEVRGIPERCVMIDPLDPTRRRDIRVGTRYEDLLRPVLRGGRPVSDVETDLDVIRSRAQSELGRFHGGIKRFVNPHIYPVGLEAQLHDLKTELTLAARGAAR